MKIKSKRTNLFRRFFSGILIVSLIMPGSYWTKQETVDAAISSFVSYSHFLKTDDTVIKDNYGKGNQIVLKGVNAGGYMLQELWMCPTKSSTGTYTVKDQMSIMETLTTRFGKDKARQLIKTYEDNYWTEDDFENCKNLGFNCIRLPIWYRNLVDENNHWYGEALERLDWFVEEAGQRGLYVILDMHGAYGSQSGSDHSGVDGGDDKLGATEFFFGNNAATNQQKYYAMWEKLVTHFKGNPVIAGYDILNEPYSSYRYDEDFLTRAGGQGAARKMLWDIYDTAYQRIRAIDEDHIIFMEATWWPDDLPDPNGGSNSANGVDDATYNWENVVYEYHQYKYNADNDVTEQINSMTGKLQNVQSHVTEYHVPAMIGEFNYFSNTESWTQGMTLLNDSGLSWMMWSYKATGSGNNWGIYNQNIESANLETDSYAEILAKWSNVGNATLNTNISTALQVSSASLGDLTDGEFSAQAAPTVTATGGIATIDLNVTSIVGMPADTQYYVYLDDALSPSRIFTPRIEAEDWSQQSGIMKDNPHLDSDGNTISNVGGTHNGDWTRYANINFGTGRATEFMARYSMEYSSVGGTPRLEIYADSMTAANLIGTLYLEKKEDEGWNNYKTAGCVLDQSVTGSHDIYVKYCVDNGQNVCNLDWIQFDAQPINHMETKLTGITSGTHSVTVKACTDGIFSRGTVIRNIEVQNYPVSEQIAIEGFQIKTNATNDKIAFRTVSKAPNIGTDILVDDETYTIRHVGTIFTLDTNTSGDEADSVMDGSYVFLNDTPVEGKEYTYVGAKQYDGQDRTVGYLSTEQGILENWNVEDEDNTYYVMTMMDVNDIVTNTLHIKAFVLAEDSQGDTVIIYGNGATDMSVAEVAYHIYCESLASNYRGHDYLYDTILSQLPAENPFYKNETVAYGWNDNLYEPGDIPANVTTSTTPKLVDDVYQITKVSELLWVAEHPSQDYILMNDLDLSWQNTWEPIGNSGKPFSGTFDGNGHAIKLDISNSQTTSGVYMDGLFGWVSGTISNLTVRGCIESKLYSGSIGGVVAYLKGGMLLNCTNEATITATATNNVLHVGGLVGISGTDDNKIATIEDCSNTGGIEVFATSSTSNDALIGTGTNTGSVGGILGFATDCTDVEIGRTINYGNITVHGGKDNIGGIVGQTSTHTATSEVIISYCANKGNITGYEITGERASGIIGYVKSGRIEYCYNVGSVIEYTDSEGQNEANIGYGSSFGIVGYAKLASDNRLQVTYCYNGSPNALHGEIALLRGVSFATCQNYYMQGRSEYGPRGENATAGTAFSDAADLYAKLRATTQGANAYISNSDNYPLLYFESGADTFGTVNIGLSGLSSYAYYEGTVSSSAYNCGPGMVSDENRTKDAELANDSKMVIVSDTNATSFERYAAKLLENGFELQDKTVFEDNVHYSFEKNNVYYYMYYTAGKSEARFIEDHSSTVSMKEVSSEKTGRKKTELYMYSIDYTKNEHTTSTTHFWQIDCGMMYMIKLPDNSLFLIDSGHERQSSKEAMEAQIKFMKKITNTPEDGKVKIRGWFFSHAHGDHVFGAHRLVELYHDSLDIECTMFNFPAYNMTGGVTGYDSGTFRMKDSINTYYPSVEHVSLHTGQCFTIQGVEFQTLSTHEDWATQNGTSSLGGDMNTASTVLKIIIDGKSLMLLGDLTQSTQMESLYSNATLQADMVQVAHHGYNRLQSLYTKIAAPYALCPNSKENAGTSSSNSEKIGDVIAAGATTVLYGGDDTHKLTVEGDQISITNIDRYTEALGIDFEHPVSNVSEVDGASASVATLADVIARTNLSDKLITVSVLGSAVTSGNASNAIRTENAYCAFDGSTSTKWCTGTIPAYVKWKMTEPVTISNYVFYTGNDTANNSGRNPTKWILKGSNDGETWETLDAVSNGSLPAANKTGTAFAVKNPKEYQYYSIQFFTIGSGSIMQLSEIELYE